MSVQLSKPHHAGLRIGRRILHQLRASLERDAGLQAASCLQEAGFAGGEELYAEFTDWLLATKGVAHPPDLDVEFLSDALSEFFAEQGWGALTAAPFGNSVMALDSSEWAEAAAESRGEFPSCHLTCGLLADFFGRLSGQVVAVMEVECRSRGDARCRFLAGAPETLGTLYDRMTQGTAYTDALGVSSSS